MSGTLLRKIGSAAAENRLRSAAGRERLASRKERQQHIPVLSEAEAQGWAAAKAFCSTCTAAATAAAARPMAKRSCADCARTAGVVMRVLVSLNLLAGICLLVFGTTVERPINSFPPVAMILLAVLSFASAITGLVGGHKWACCLDAFLALHSLNTLCQLILVAVLFSDFHSVGLVEVKQRQMLACMRACPQADTHAHETGFNRPPVYRPLRPRARDGGAQGRQVADARVSDLRARRARAQPADSVRGTGMCMHQHAHSHGCAVASRAESHLVACKSCITLLPACCQVCAAAAHICI